MIDPTDGSGRRLPGLVVERVHTDEDTWLARVVQPAQVEPGVWVTVEGWLPARAIEPT